MLLENYMYFIKIYLKQISKHGQCGKALENVSEEARDFVYSILHVCPKRRLGYNGVEEVKNHAWFTKVNFNWSALESRNYSLIPFKPQTDHANCDSKYDLSDEKDKEIDPMSKQVLTQTHVFDVF